jgi:chitinase
MRRTIKILFIIVVLGLLCCVGCKNGNRGNNAGSPAGNPTGPAANEGLKHIGGKEVIVYFPNWKLGTPNGNVEDIPWDRVTMINHAFFEIVPVGEETETSFARRAAGKEARTQFAIVSTLPEADKEIFEKYKQYHSLYPDVKIMISIGGWSRCGFFSEMAHTAEGRNSFVRSCIDLIKENEWIAGIDIDWEYPAGSNDGERKPEGGDDQGCPIFGTSLEDRMNFPELLKALKEGLDREFGAGKKLVTACASSSTGWTLPNQNWLAASEFVDYINIMTYDMAGDWDKQAGHASSVSGTKNAMAYFINAGVDKRKLNLGIPYYGTGFKLSGATKNPFGSKIVVPNGIDKDFLTVAQVKKFEQEVVADDAAGWHKGYNDKVGAAYLWNDDEKSEYFCWYISYECTDAIDGVFELIDRYSLAGVLVWEITEDTLDHEFTKYLSDMLK